MEKIQNAKKYISLIGKKEESLEEKLGYNGEKLVLKVQELYLNTCWGTGTLSKKYITAKVNDDEKLVCVIAIGYVETQGNERKIRTFETISKTAKNVPTWYKKGIECVLFAPSAMNQQKYIFELIDNDKVKTTHKRAHLTNLDLGIAKYHFEIGAGIDNFKRG